MPFRLLFLATFIVGILPVQAKDATEIVEIADKKMQGNYVNGEKDGNFILWFQNGQKKFEIIYENNLMVKKWTYNSDKSKHTKYNYVNGKFEKIDGEEFHTHTKKNKTFN